MSHLSPDELERFVTGSLDPAAAELVEAHVEACPPCAQALAAEARLEVCLLEVGESLSQPAPAKVLALPERRRRRTVAAVVSTLGVLAAAALVIFVEVDRPTPAGKGPHINRCEDPRQAANCIAQGEFDGVITIGPDRQLIVPRYDAVARVP